MTTSAYRVIHLTATQQAELHTYGSVLSFLESFSHDTIAERDEYLARYDGIELHTSTRETLTLTLTDEQRNMLADILSRHTFDAGDATESSLYAILNRAGLIRNIE